MSESRAIVARKPAGEIELVRNLDDVANIAKFAADSKLYGDIKLPEAVVKILSGHEMGFGPMQSLASVHVIEGKPVPGADLIASALRRPGSGYDYEAEVSDEVAKVTIFRYMGGIRKEIGSVRYTYEEAKAKGWNLTQNGKEKMTWRTKTANMLFARAITDAKRFFAPDVLTSSFDQDEIDSPSFAPEAVKVQVLPDSGRKPTHFCDAGKPTTVEKDPERTTDLVVNEDGSMSSPVDEINRLHQSIISLCKEKGITPERMSKKLQMDYGVTSLYEIQDVGTLQILEGQVKAVKASNSKPAAAAVPAAS